MKNQNLPFLSKKFIIIIFIVSSAVFLYLPVAGSGESAKAQDSGTVSFGASPATIANRLLLPGSSFTQEIVLSRANPTTDAVAELEVDAPEINSWLKFTPGNIVDMPKDTQRVPVKLQVNVPENTKLGDYRGSIRVKLGDKNAGGQVVLTPGVRLDLFLTVTDQHVANITVLMAEIPDAHPGQPVQLVLTVQNSGNISGKPDKISLDISDIRQKFLKTLETYPTETVAPFTTKKITISLANHGLEPGQYFATVTAFTDKKNIYQNLVTFKITEQPIIPPAENKTDNSRQQKLLIIVAIGSVILTLALGLILLAKKLVIAKKRGQAKTKLN